MTPGMILEMQYLPVPSAMLAWIRRWFGEIWAMKSSEERGSARPCQGERAGDPSRMAAAGRETAGVAAAGTAKPGILVVEDNPINQKILEVLLRKRGYDVAVAHDGDEALRRLMERPYGLVLMDLQMPVLDGYAATRRIRENPELSAVPVVAVTAYAMNGEKQKCLAAGMNGYLAKPVDREELFAIVEQYLNQVSRS